MVFSREDHTMAVVEKFERNTPILKKQHGKMKKILPLTFLLTDKMNGYMQKEKKLMFQMRIGYSFRCNLFVPCHEAAFCE